MARLDALNMFQSDGTTEVLLAEEYGKLIENVFAGAVSTQLKNVDLSGDPMGGSVEAQRVLNSVSAAYGTARAAGAGVGIEANPVTVPLDQHKEIINEAEMFDLERIGLPAFLQRKAANNKYAMIKELDTAFFTEAYQQGSKVTTTATTEIGKLEELILALETVDSDFVDGIGRDMMGLVLSPTQHSAVRLEIDELPAQDNFYMRGAIGVFHSVPVFVSNHLPKATGQVVDAMVMAFGSVAQPVAVKDYGINRIPLSTAVATELFYDYGTKAVTEDLIFYIGDAYSA